tara:strand:- start:287 stop:412 length:126 start_codon:yes stop_codon:yes gene_type:complete
MSDFEIIVIFFGLLSGLVLAPSVLHWLIEKKKEWTGKGKTD